MAPSRAGLVVAATLLMVAAPLAMLLPATAGRFGHLRYGDGGISPPWRFVSTSSSVSTAQDAASPLGLLLLGAFAAAGWHTGGTRHRVSWRHWHQRQISAQRVALGMAGHRRRGDDQVAAEATVAQESQEAVGWSEEVVGVKRQQFGWLRRTLRRLAGLNLEADLEARLLKAQDISAALEASLGIKDKALSEVSQELEVAKDHGSKEQELREALEAEVKAISRAAGLNEARLRNNLVEQEKKALALKSAYDDISDALEGSQTEVESELQRLRDQLVNATRRADAAIEEKNAFEGASRKEMDELRRELEEERARSDGLEQDRARAVRDVMQAEKENERLRSELDFSQETLTTMIKRLENWKIRSSTSQRPPTQH